MRVAPRLTLQLATSSPEAPQQRLKFEQRGVNLSLIVSEDSHSQARKVLLRPKLWPAPMCGPGVVWPPGVRPGCRPADEDSSTRQGKWKCHSGRLQSLIRPLQILAPTLSLQCQRALNTSLRRTLGWFRSRCVLSGVSLVMRLSLVRLFP